MQDNKQYEILRKMRTKTAFTFSLGKSFFFFFFFIAGADIDSSPNQCKVNFRGNPHLKTKRGKQKHANEIPE